MTEGAEPSELGDLLAPYWSAHHTMKELGLSPVQLDEARQGGGVLGVAATDGACFYPVWQFRRRSGTVEVKPGIAAVLRMLRSLEGWTTGVFLRMSAPELDDLTPEAWIDEGRDPTVLLRYARVFLAEMKRP